MSPNILRLSPSHPPSFLSLGLSPLSLLTLIITTPPPPFFLANTRVSTPAHAHKHYPTAVPANCLCVLRPESLRINLWCNHGYRTTGNYKISSIFNVTLIMFEYVLMEKGIKEMKQFSICEEWGESLCLPSLTAWNPIPGKAQSILKCTGLPGSIGYTHQNMQYTD